MTAARTKTKQVSWRDVLPVHPAADVFPLMGEDELRTLAEDIRKNGVKIPITLWAEDHTQPVQLLDGRNRLDAMELIGMYPVAPDGTRSAALQGIRWETLLGKYQSLVGSSIELRAGVDPYEFVMSANIHRRHLTAEKKRDLIAKVLMMMPEKSNREIAKMIKADKKTVNAVAKKLLDGPIGPSSKGRSRQAMAKRAAIIELLKTGELSSNEIRKKLHVSPNVISAVKKELDATPSANPPPTPSGNACDPEASAEEMKRKFAAMDAERPPADRPPQSQRYRIIVGLWRKLDANERKAFLDFIKKECG